MGELIENLKLYSEPWNGDPSEGRNSFIGGSDVGTILGVNKFKSPYVLFLEKTGKLEPENIDNKLQVKLGHKMEQVVAELYEEETGIKLIDAKLKPFEKITYYNKNYHETGKNRENDIYYYIIKTDAKFDMNNSRLDESEKEGNYIPKTFPIKNIEQILIDSIPDNPINEVIVEEMLDSLKEYNKITNIKND